jgi:hypothetical protein
MAALPYEARLPVSGKQPSSRKETTMNLTTIGKNSSSTWPSSHNWKRFKGQYVAAAAGIALAVSGALALTGQHGSQTTATTPAPRDFDVTMTRSSDTPQHYFFIVRDEAQQAQLLAANSELRSQDAGRADITVLVAGSREAELLQTIGAQELSALGASYVISDMSAPASPAAAVPQREVSQADVTAAALSTDMANYDFGASNAERLLVASPDDIMASVLSTEGAAYGLVQPATASLGIEDAVVRSRTLDADIQASVLSTEQAAYGATAESRKVAEADVLAAARSGEQATYVAGATQTLREASPDDIMASVLSTELATFPVPAQQAWSDGDVMDAILAGARSSELALYGN